MSDIPTDPSRADAEGAGTECDPPSRTTDLISEVERAGNVTRELTTTAFEGEYANPSEILPTNEGLTLFRGAGAEQKPDSGHSRRNGWHPDRTLDLVGKWITQRRQKSADS